MFHSELPGLLFVRLSKLLVNHCWFISFFSLFLSIYLTTYLSFCLSLHQSVRLCIYLSSVYLSVYLPIRLSIDLSVCLFCLSVGLSVCLCICLSIYLFLFGLSIIWRYACVACLLLVGATRCVIFQLLFCLRSFTGVCQCCWCWWGFHFGVWLSAGQYFYGVLIFSWYFLIF